MHVFGRERLGEAFINLPKGEQANVARIIKRKDVQSNKSNKTYDGETQKPLRL